MIEKWLLKLFHLGERRSSEDLKLEQIRNIQIEADDKINVMMEKVRELNDTGAHVTLNIRLGKECRQEGGQNADSDACRNFSDR